MKKKILSKCTLLLMLIMSLTAFLSQIVFANTIETVDTNNPILYDHWKNGDGWQQVIDASGQTIDVNGSAVEYNGLRIVKKSDSGTLGTVYCKSGDTLGITSWIKTYSESNGSQYWPKEDYLALFQNDSCFSIFRNSIPQLSDRTNFDYPNNSDPVLTYSLNPDGSNPSWFGNTGIDSSTGAHKWGNLYYIKFGNANGTTANGRKYTLMSNAVNYNGDWIKSMIGWPTMIGNWVQGTESEENIQVYDNKPIPTITGTSNNGSAAIKINVADATVGIQQYTYTITAPDGTVTTKTVQATDKGHDESSKSYGTWLAPSQIGYMGGTGGAAETLTHPAYNLTEMANVSGAGTYHVHVTAINNLGFKDDNNFDGDIIVPQPTPTSPSNPSNPDNPDNPDDPDKPQPPPPTLSAQIVPYDNQNFIGTPTLKRGQMAILKIYTTQYATRITASFPFTVLPDVNALQNFVNHKYYDSFINKSMNVVPQESAENDIVFVIPLNKNIAEMLYRVQVQANYQDGSTLSAAPAFKIQGNITDLIRTMLVEN